MERVKDIFNWQRMEQWKFVIDRGAVEWEQSECMNVDDKKLEEALVLLEQNCFPFAIICLRKDSRKVVLNPSLWKALFDFINDERGIKMGQKKIYFGDLDSKVRNNILNAEILSIWMIP